MADRIVTISGMFGAGKTYFADAPVTIHISGLYWGQPVTSPFCIVWVEVIYNGKVVGAFKEDTGGQTSVTFDIHTALQSIWADVEFDAEVSAANDALTAVNGIAGSRQMRGYSLRIYTEYLASDGEYTKAYYADAGGNREIAGGQCIIGGLTEWERSLIQDDSDADVSHLDHTGVRNGDASTKPTTSPEHVGSTSITSWVDVQQGLTKSIFYPKSVTPQADDIPGRQQGWQGHAPLVLRDSIPYTDFLFVNRRGAVETCSAKMMPSMDIDVQTQSYTRTEGPAFKPERTLTSFSSGGRRSWSMSSGYVTREWAEWWTMEFLRARRRWMLYKGPGMSEAKFVPVVVTTERKNNSIYDKAKQTMAHIDFTVTLALEG